MGGFAGRAWNKMLMQPFIPGRGISDDQWNNIDWSKGERNRIDIENERKERERKPAERKQKQLDTYLLRLAKHLNAKKDSSDKAN